MSCGVRHEERLLVTPKKSTTHIFSTAGTRGMFSTSADDVYKIRIVVGRPPLNFDRCICLHQNATHVMFISSVNCLAMLLS